MMDVARPWNDAADTTEVDEEGPMGAEEPEMAERPFESLEAQSDLQDILGHRNSGQRSI